ncbi:Nucleoporin p58/p45 [Phytophthora cinnamomi]|uniref:Nucleoporin p58/p45 n=1 Tax=Phytophthora cinnamomi TaxID=4785 RepID=UPI00355ABC30|nr:Nucleoporin p58/p45 [Phytophthora cinnamomi]
MAFSFGATAAPAASSGFSFGATPAAPAASSGFSFGATSATPAASSGFGFGATPAPAASTGFGFGSAPAAASSGFSFGATPAASSGFSFGAKPAAAPSTGFSFGGASAAPASAAPSLFGAAGSTTTTPAATGFGFGGFGSATTQQPAATGGFGGFGFGAGASTPAAPAQPAGPPITLETAFENLPDDVKKNMAQFHAFLKEQDQSDAFLKTVSPRQMEVLRENMARLEQEVLARRNRQDRQAAAVQHVRQDVRQLLHQVDAATLTRRSLDSSNGGTPNMYHVMRRVEMPSPYYWELLDHYEQKMAAIKAQIEDVEAQFKPLYDGRGSSANSSANGMPAPAQLQQILLAQNAALMQAAARVAEVHEKAEEMRQLFLAKMQEDLARHGEKNPAAFQNPFDKRKKSSEADKRQAIDKIRFRTSVAPTIVTPSQPAAAAPAASTSTFGFGTAAPAATASAAPTSGFSFGSTASSAAAKTVSFNLTSTTATSVAPPAATTSVTAAPLATASTTAPAAGGFTAPTVATSGFGSITSSFLPPATADNKASAGTKRGGRAQKMRK